MTRFSFNWRRFWAIVLKEFIQMRRDRVTFGMMVGIPLVQLILFGFAINSDPKHLPTAIYSADNSAVFAHARLGPAQQRLFRHHPRGARTRRTSSKCSRRATVQFVINIPEDFSRKLLRGEKPDVLIEADATDPAAVGYAIAAVNLPDDARCSTAT